MSRRSHTVFLVRDDPVVAELLARWTSWSASGLLHPVSVMDAARVPDRERLSEMSHHLIVDGDVGAEGDFFSWLAANYVSLLRIVAVHIDGPPEDCKAFARQVDRFRDYMRGWVGADQSTMSMAVYLSTPSEEGFDLDIVNAAWGAHLVLDPASQAMPGSASAPVAVRTRTAVNQAYASSAAASLAAVGGVWSNLTEGPFDRRNPGSVAAMVQVVRTFVRAVDFPDPTPELAEVALQPLEIRGGTGWPLVSTIGGVTSADPPTVFVNKAAEELLDVHKSHFDAAIPPPPLPRPVTKLRLAQTLRIFFGYLWAGIRRAPARWADSAATRLSEKASRIATAYVFGANSDFEVVVGRPGQRPVESLEAVDNAVQSAFRLLDPAADFLPPSAEGLWRDFLQLGLSLIDGSDLPPGFTVPRIGDGRALVQDPATITVPPTFPKITVPAKLLGPGQRTAVTLDATDPRLAFVTVEQLKGHRDRIAGSDPSEDAEQPTPSNSVGPDDVVLESEPVPPGGEEEPKRKSGRSDESKKLQIKQIEAKIAEVQEWIEKARRPLAWQVGERIGASLHETEQALARYWATLQAGPGDPPDRALHGAGRTVLWIFAGILGAVGAWLFFKIEQISGGWAWALGISSVALGVAIGLRNFIKELRRQFKAIHAYESGIDQLNVAAESFMKVSTEEMRLASLYWQLQQWSKVLSGLSHDPFGERVEEHSEGEILLIKDGPLSVRSATATTEKDRLEALVNEVRRSVFTGGWLIRACELAIRGTTEELQRRQALHHLPDPYADRMRRSTGALEYLVKAIEAGYHGMLIRRSQSSSIQHQLIASPLSSVIGEVKVDGTLGYPDPAAPPTADPTTGLFDEILGPDAPGPQQFHPTMWTNMGTGVDGDPRISESIIAATEGMAVADAPHRRRIPSLPLEHDGRMMLWACRIDLSEPCLPRDLVVFKPPRPEPPPPPPPDDEDAHD